MGFGGLTEWVIGKIKLANHKRNEKFGPNPFGSRRIYIIPLFHHSIIPCVGQDYQASINTYNFNKLQKLRDVEIASIQSRQDIAGLRWLPIGSPSPFHGLKSRWILQVLIFYHRGELPVKPFSLSELTNHRWGGI